MSQPEARIGKRIREYLEREHGAFVFKVHGGPQMMAGLPDLIACWPHDGVGRFLGVEVKQPGQNAAPRQVFVHNQIRRSSGLVTVGHSVEEVAAFLESPP